MKYNSNFVIVYCFITMFFVIYIYNSPQLNWDILPYMALSYENDGLSSDSIHANTYEFAKNNFSDSKFEALITGDYRARLFNNATDFYNQLSLYRVKPLYNWSVFSFSKLGFPLHKSTILPNIIAFMGIAFFIYCWLIKFLDQKISVLLSTLLISFLIPFATLSTPDILSVCFIFASAYYINSKVYIPIILLALSVLTRIDNVVFASLFGLYVLHKHQTKKIIYFLYLLLLFCMVGWINFYISKGSDLLFNAPHFSSFNNYSIILIKNIYGLFFLSPFSIIVFVGIFILRKTNINKYKTTLLIIICSMLIRMIIIPVYDQRFYIAYELLFIIFVLELMGPTISRKTKKYVG